MSLDSDGDGNDVDRGVGTERSIDLNKHKWQSVRAMDKKGKEKQEAVTEKGWVAVGCRRRHPNAGAVERTDK